MNIGGLKTEKDKYLSRRTQADKTVYIKNPQGRAKTVRPPRIPPLVTDIIQSALASLDSMEFSHIGSCPVCGGILQAHDRKKKRFAVLREQSGKRVITVRVKRFYCQRCGNLFYADEPFYPGSRIGSPVVDIFLSLSATMPPSRAARVIDTMGIVVNRTTWKHYIGLRFPEIPVVEVFGMRLPLSVVRLSDLAVQSPESGTADPEDVIGACGFPSRIERSAGTSVKI